MVDAQKKLISRDILQVLLNRINESPVVLVEGARSVGKSTVLRLANETLGGNIVDLDDEAMMRIAESNIAWIVDQQTPVIIDEYQRIPELLQGIKRRLNVESKPGMFVLAGSASLESLPHDIQSLTGRIQRIDVSPLTQSEIDGLKTRFLEDAFDGTWEPSLPTPTTKREEYEQRVIRGGMPLAITQPDEASRARWFEGFLRQLTERDLPGVARKDRRVNTGRLVHHFASQTGRLFNASAIARDAGISQPTVSTYLDHLESVFIVNSLPAWAPTRHQEASRTPKLHVVDSGFGAFLLGLSSQKLARRDPTSLTEFGYLLESFVVNEVIRHAQLLPEPVRCGHWRLTQDVEVDLVLERYDGDVLGIEVKAADRVSQRDVKGLVALRKKLGRAFSGGLIITLGSAEYFLDDNIRVVPLNRLWRPNDGS